MMSFFKPLFLGLVGCIADSDSGSLMQTLATVDADGEISDGVSSDLLEHINSEIQAQVHEELSKLRSSLLDGANFTGEDLVPMQNILMETDTEDGSGLPCFHY